MDYGSIFVSKWDGVSFIVVKRGNCTTTSPAKRRSILLSALQLSCFMQLDMSGPFSLTVTRNVTCLASLIYISFFECTFPYYSLVASPPRATSGVKHGDFFLLIFGSPLTSHLTSPGSPLKAIQLGSQSTSAS